MTFSTRAILNIKRKPGKVAVLFGLIFLLGVLSSGVILVRQGIEQTEANLRERLPSVTTLQWELHEEGYMDGDRHVMEFPTLEMIESVGSLPYVRDYDFRSGLGLFSQELNVVQLSTIQNLVPEEILQRNPEVTNELESAILSFRELGAYVELFSVTGINNPEPIHVQAELIYLESGRFMTEIELNDGAPVAVVSSLFAEVNHLELGSTFTLEHTIHDQATIINEGVNALFLYWHLDDFIFAQQSIEFEVIGIFDVNKTNLHIDSETFEAMAFDVTDLYNQIYVPHLLLEEMERSFFTYRQMDMQAMASLDGILFDTGVTEEAPLGLRATFILNNPRDFDAFAEAASYVLPDTWYVVDTSGSFSPIRSAMDNLLWISQLIFWGGIIATLMLLGLTITFFFNDRKYEIGIYRTLGETKVKIAYQLLIEVFSISITAIAAALLAGNALSAPISRQMLEQDLIRQEEEGAFIGFSEGINSELILFDPGPMSIEEMMDAYDLSMNVNSIALFFGIQIVVISLSTVIPITYVLKMEPKDILMKGSVG